MGQKIELRNATVLGDVLVIDTDRSITGQDGTSYDSVEAASDGSFPADLATALFTGDDTVDHVFVASNQVVVKRAGGWDDGAVAGASKAVSEFFVFYADEGGA